MGFSCADKYPYLTTIDYYFSAAAARFIIYEDLKWGIMLPVNRLLRIRGDWLGYGFWSETR